MSRGIALLIAAAGLSAVMAIAWWVRRRTGQAGWIDAIWSLGTGAAGMFTALSPVGPVAARQYLVAALVGLWGLRLGLHIARRAANSAHDDPRYADLKKQWGAAFEGRLFLFLQIQALCGFGLAITAFAAAHNPRATLGPPEAIGAAILLASVLGEGLADAQLRRFARDPANKGKVCDAGLWRWSRHPNYFFEWLGWLGYVVIALDLAGGYPLGWLALVGPILIYWLLVHASGIPPLEAHMLRSRGDAFRAYQRRTSAFFPLPPKDRA